MRAEACAREASPQKGLNPNTPAFQPSASPGQTVLRFGDAAFTWTFTRPASSSTTGQVSLLGSFDVSHIQQQLNKVESMLNRVNPL